MKQRRYHNTQTRDNIEKFVFYLNPETQRWRRLIVQHARLSAMEVYFWKKYVTNCVRDPLACKEAQLRQNLREGRYGIALFTSLPCEPLTSFEKGVPLGLISKHMGKSDKKIKSDRINSLRKKYDAFLEEDKKRKERNEYILGKLDKMRCCTAVVPVRQKPAAFIETRTANFHNVPKQAVESPTSLPYNDHRLLHLETPRKHVDETILQEISKKYILIPKLRSTCDDYVIDTKPKIDDNTDWKSKYQILEQLKRDEKEQDSPTHQENFQARQDEANNNYKEITTKDDRQTLLEYKNELPDHFISEDQLPYNLQSYANDTEEVEQKHYDGTINEKVGTANDEVENDKNNIENYESNTEYDIKDQAKTIDNTVMFDKNINYYGYVENVDETILSPELDTVIKMTQENPAKDYPKADASRSIIQNDPLVSNLSENPKEDKGNKEDNINQETYLDKEEVTIVQDMNAGNIINVINNDLAPESDSNVFENIDYPVETIDVHHFTPHEDVQLQDGVNINPEPQVMVGQDDVTYHYDPVVEPENDTEPIKTFDTEQDQELYNKQTGQNYDYTEEALVDNYNTEYTTPNENYEHNEYAYYEGAQAEQAYPEANDNEETTQRYDQNYEQQYGAAYNQEGYEQGYAQDHEQPEYTEQIQHYEAPDHAGLEKVQYEENQDNLTPQYVEQQLDNEQGYAEKPDGHIEISNVEKPIEKQQNVEVGDQQAQ